MVDAGPWSDACPLICVPNGLARFTCFDLSRSDLLSVYEDSDHSFYGGLSQRTVVFVNMFKVSIDFVHFVTSILLERMESDVFSFFCLLVQDHRAMGTSYQRWEDQNIETSNI